VVYEDNGIAYYQISDSNTGQQIIQRTSLGANSLEPRVYAIGQYFIVVFLETITANIHLRYIAIPTMVPTSPLPVQDIATGLKSGGGHDGVIANNALYLGWTEAAGNLQFAFLSSMVLLPASGLRSGILGVRMDSPHSTHQP
jgi:hypothetical protein